MGTKILVIEDSSELLSDIKQMLMLEGYEVMTAENGKVGVEVAKAKNPDLIVCDIRMPLMDGYGVLEQVRSDPNTMNTPFIFLTARTGRSEIREGMQLGADDYLPKPFTAEELIESVSTRLARRKVTTTETARKLNELRNSIALALPHEMRTPLNTILGFSEILMTDKDNLDLAQSLSMAEHINSAALRLYRLVENYIIYANLELIRDNEERRRYLERGRADYAGVTIAQQVQQKAIEHERESDLVTDISAFERPVAIDSDNLARIVNEIIDNAFKFSEAGSQVQVTAHAEDNRLHIQIKDQGWGIQQQDIESIGAYMQFERAFFEQQGIGFGLVIASRMTELHGGLFQIQSEPKKYTDVHIWLPFAV